MTSIKYKTTRNSACCDDFEHVVLRGMPLDGGLYVPTVIPEISVFNIEKLRPISFVDLAFEIIRLYVQDEQVPANDLRGIIEASFGTFLSRDVIPVKLVNNAWFVELFHGPTLAFKDVALQFVGNLFEYLLSRKSEVRLTIIGATSGDTGSAAMYSVKGKKNIKCFMLFPQGKVSAIQEKQMTTIVENNIFPISLEGTFDDAQSLVKKCFTDKEFANEISLGAVNSINWARIMVQITYYFYSWLRATDSSVTNTVNGGSCNNNDNVLMKVNYIVPTGNFGDILAGYYAKRMGLPIDTLIIATNQNDILHQCILTGVYERKQSVETYAPSMDISISSNFERYLYYITNEDSNILKSWMNTFETTGKLQISSELLSKVQQDFLSYSANNDIILQTISQLYYNYHYLVCPHTATAVAAFNHYHNNNHKQNNEVNTGVSLILATAHPMKFEQTIVTALNSTNIKTTNKTTTIIEQDMRSKVLDNIAELPTRKYEIKNDLNSLKAFVRTHVVISNNKI